jgi:hypothetical protein
MVSMRPVKSIIAYLALFISHIPLLIWHFSIRCSAAITSVLQCEMRNEQCTMQNPQSAIVNIQSEMSLLPALQGWKWYCGWPGRLQCPVSDYTHKQRSSACAIIFEEDRTTQPFESAVRSRNCPHALQKCTSLRARAVQDLQNQSHGIVTGCGNPIWSPLVKLLKSPHKSGLL